MTALQKRRANSLFGSYLSLFMTRCSLLLPVVMLLSLSCASSQHGTSVLQQAREKLGENVEFLYSPTEEFVVYIKRYPSPVSDPRKHVEFLLCDPANDIILLEDEQPNADNARNGQKTDLAQFNKAQQQ